MSSVAGADFYTLAGVQEIRERGERELNLLMSAHDLDTDNLVDNIISNLGVAIWFLNTQQQQFLNMFGCKEPSDFKEKVENYYNTNPIGNFTGKELKELVKEFNAINNIKIQQRGDWMQRLIYNIVQKDFKDFTKGDLKKQFESKQVTEAAREFVVERVITLLSQIGLGKGGVLKKEATSRAIKLGSNDSGEHFFEVAAHATTTAFNGHINHLYSLFEKGQFSQQNLTEQQKNSLLKAAEYLKPIVDTDISGMQMEQTFAVEWVGNISKLTDDGSGNKTGKGSDLSVPLDSNELIEMNNIMCQLVTDKLMSYAPNNNSQMRNFIEERIQYMISQDPKMFFVGASSTQFEGILGEISAIVALSDLLGENYEPQIISWIGSQRGASKKQPSVDIAIQEIGGWQYGVQVKNTVDELKDGFLHNIKFVDASVDLIFQKLGIQSDGIQNVLIANHFNVPYKVYGNVYQAPKNMPPTFKHQDGGAFDDYLNEDKLIDNIVADIIAYLTLFAPDFLYIGLGESFRSQLATLDAEVLRIGRGGGNFVYIVGNKVFFATEILKQLQEDLELLKNVRDRNEQMSFQLQTSFDSLEGDESEGTYNIITWKNNRGMGRPALAEHTLKMRSSWNFHE